MKIKDHKKLHFSFEELGAFLGTYTMLRTGVLKMQNPRYNGGIEAQPGKHTFNMGRAGEEKDCGSVGCIGGNMAFIMGLGPDEYVGESHGEKRKLFYPPSKYAYSKIPIKAVLKAMENYAATGKANWAKILGSKYLGRND